MRPPQFDNISTEKFYHDSYSLMKNLQQKYRKQIDSEQK